METTNILELAPMSFPWATNDPFIFCVHHRDHYPKGNGKMGPDASLEGRRIGQDFDLKDGWRMYHGKEVPGFPCHPHRGFETITVVKEGIVDHADSMGAAGRYSSGDVQWMTAGKGVQHSEMFPVLNTDNDNPLELFQIWLNLPGRNKFVEPDFKMLWAEDIPVISQKDRSGNLTEVNLLAGSLDGFTAPGPTANSWANDPDNEVLILTIKMEANARWTLERTRNEVNRTLYFYRGNEMFMDDQQIPFYHSVDVLSTADLELEAGNEDCYLLVLQAKPIEEEVVQYGPFVMNTREEIADAYKDFSETHFGGWPWENYEQVHGKEKGRFARHANGKEEVR